MGVWWYLELNIWLWLRKNDWYMKTKYWIITNRKNKGRNRST